MNPADLPCAWLTTLRRDGSPHTTPVWFVLEDDTFWIGSSLSSVKVQNLLRDDRVSLAVDGTGARPWVAEGRAVVHEPIDRERWHEVLDAFADRYDGWDAADPSVYGHRVLLEVPVARWLMNG